MNRINIPCQCGGTLKLLPIIFNSNREDYFFECEKCKRVSQTVVFFGEHYDVPNSSKEEYKKMGGILDEDESSQITEINHDNNMRLEEIQKIIDKYEISTKDLFSLKFHIISLAINSEKLGYFKSRLEEGK